MSSVLRPFPTLHSFSPESVGPKHDAQGQRMTGLVSVTWVTANMAVFVPFALEVPITAKQMFLLNGATASGNVDVGIYTADGIRLVSIGSTAQAGINDLQAFNITDTILGPGRYYFAVAMDGTAGTILGASASATLARAMGYQQMATAFPLPATATFATGSASANLGAVVGLTQRSFV